MQVQRAQQVAIDAWASATDSPQRAFGSRISARLRQPLLVPDDTQTIKAELKDVWLTDPCGL